MAAFGVLGNLLAYLFMLMAFMVCMRRIDLVHCVLTLLIVVYTCLPFLFERRWLLLVCCINAIVLIGYSALVAVPAYPSVTEWSEQHNIGRPRALDILAQSPPMSPI